MIWVKKFDTKLFQHHRWKKVNWGLVSLCLYCVLWGGYLEVVVGVDFGEEQCGDYILSKISYACYVINICFHILCPFVSRPQSGFFTFCVPTNIVLVSFLTVPNTCSVMQ
jgi:hypothetical protein